MNKLTITGEAVGLITELARLSGTPRVAELADALFWEQDDFGRLAEMLRQQAEEQEG